MYENSDNDINNKLGTLPSSFLEFNTILQTLEDQIQLKTDKEEQEVVSNQAPVIRSNGTGISYSRREVIRYHIVRNICIGIISFGIFAGLLVWFLPGQNSNDPYFYCIPLWNENSAAFLSMLGDGNCDRHRNNKMNLNSEECGYDAGDCDEFNKKYKDCVPGTHPSDLNDLGSQYCKPKYNTKACGFDDGLCRTQFNLDYPNCEAEEISDIGDGYCNNNFTNTKECGWEGGDCLHRKYPNCTGINPKDLYETNICNLELNKEECGFDNGACISFNENYPNCNTVSNPDELNNQKCYNSIHYNHERCGYDGGDCIDFNNKYPDCNVLQAHRINDTKCDNDRSSFNTAECGFDGGDCVEFNKNASYTECDVIDVSKLKNGECNGILTDNPRGYNSEQCAFDGGDCIEFNAKYPSCPFYSLEKELGNGRCDYIKGQGTNIPECNFDGGDCVQYNEEYPDCDVSVYDFNFIGDGMCDDRKGYGANIVECGFEAGDCVGLNNFLQEHPYCHIWGSVSKDIIGDGRCEWGTMNNLQCGFEGGDCVKFNEAYPTCYAQYPHTVGDGNCDVTNNTPGCKFDGGDCEDFNRNYPGCETWVIPENLGNGRCDIGNNTPRCKFDGGDCLLWNEHYPDCNGDAHKFADGKCDYSNDKEECGYDGGDCAI